MRRGKGSAGARVLAWAIAAMVWGGVGEARAETCGKTAQGFDAWLGEFRGRARADGVKAATIERAFEGVVYDDEVIRLDRTQRPFKVSFERFVARRVTRERVRVGRHLLKVHAATLERVERAYGVQPAVVVALWGMETDYGRNIGDRPVFGALATLAYDCRRAERFRGELMSALRLVERGDLSPEEMRGAWAGELGQTQFLPSSYERFAVDFDGDGRADLRRSAADVLASTAHYLAGHGWRPDSGWGPGTANFEVLAAWNRSRLYQRAIAVFADRLAAER